MMPLLTHVSVSLGGVGGGETLYIYKEQVSGGEGGEWETMMIMNRVTDIRSTKEKEAAKEDAATNMEGRGGGGGG